VNDDDWPAKVESWAKKQTGLNLTPREYFDSWAKLMRPRTIEMLEGFQRSGWMSSDEELLSHFRKALDEVGFDLVPASGWSAFHYELSLIFMALTDTTDERTISNAELAKKRNADLQNSAVLKGRFFE